MSVQRDKLTPKLLQIGPSVWSSMSVQRDKTTGLFRRVRWRRWLIQLPLGLVLVGLVRASSHTHGWANFGLLFAAWLCFWIAIDIPKDRPR